MSSDPTPTRDRHIGRIIKDTYRLEAKVGVGGFGAVYKARHVKLGSAVAVKFLLPHADDLARARFEREARIAASIVHPNVARVIDIDHDDEGSPFMVIEWVEGASLRALINDRGSMTLPEAVELYHQFGSAMDAAHARGIVHRDLKPENLLLSEESGVLLLKVLDFGIARQEGSQGTLTHGVAIGTPCYMAPESARVGSSSADRRVDIYAMGLLLYECLTGRRAIDGEPMQIFAKQLTTGVEIPSVRGDHPELPEAVDAVIAKACAREPGDRYQTAGELAAALAAIPYDRAAAREVLRAAPLAGITAPGSALTPASLTPHVARTTRTPQPQPLETPLPPPQPPLPSAVVPAPVVEEFVEPPTKPGRITPVPPAAPLPSLSLPSTPIEEAPPRRTGLYVAIAAFVVAGAGLGAWAVGRGGFAPVENKPPPSAPVKPAAPATVRLQLKNFPAGGRAFDADSGKPLPVEAGALVLPRSTHAMHVRLEAPGFEKIKFEVIPEADGEINLGPGS